MCQAVVIPDMLPGTSRKKMKVQELIEYAEQN